jgi:hypothetical protein
MKVLSRYDSTYPHDSTDVLNTLWHCPPHHPLVAIGHLAHVCDLKSEPLTTLHPLCRVDLSDSGNARLLQIEAALRSTFPNCTRDTASATVFIATLDHAEAAGAACKQLLVAVNRLDVQRLEQLVIRLNEKGYRLVHTDVTLNDSTLLFHRFSDATWWD